MTFVSYKPADLVKPIVEMAFGADPDGNPASWNWTDVSSRVRPSGITIMAGKGDASGQSSSTRVDVSFNNPTPGDLTPDNPMSAFWPNILVGTPLRVSVPYGNTPPTERATVYVTSFRLRWDSGVNHSVVDVQAQGRMQRLQDTDHPIRSALSRVLRGPSTFSLTTPFAYWPCEDESGARTVAAATTGAGPLGASGAVAFAGDSSLVGSQPLPTLPDGGSIGGAIPPYSATGSWAVLMVQKIPALVTSANNILTVTTNGSARYWTITMVPGTPHTLNIRAFDQSGTMILDTAGGLPDQTAFYGSWHMFALGVKQNGSNVDYTVYSVGPSAGSTGGTLAANTCGSALGFYVAANSVTAGTAVGHFAVYTNPTFSPVADTGQMANAGLNGQAAERPSARFQRLCNEESLSNNVSSTGTALKMGPQPVGQLLDLLRECEAVDHDLMHDASPGGVLTLVARADRYSAAPTLVIDNAREQLAKGFEPVYDSTNLRTAATVRRSGGSSATYTAEDTSQGSRPDDVTLNLYDDRSLYQIAGWRANSASMKRLRYPQLGINLRKSPELQPSWLITKLGDRAQAINLPQQHGPTGATADVCIEGYIETITSETWAAELVCSPAQPYDVAVMEGVGDAAWRVDTDGATLTADITATALSWSVTITAGSGLFTTAGGDFPVDIDIDGERITLSGITGAASPQTFTASARSVNGVAKAHKAGAAVKGWRLRPLAL